MWATGTDQKSPICPGTEQGQQSPLPAGDFRREIVPETTRTEVRNYNRGQSATADAPHVHKEVTMKTHISKQHTTNAFAVQPQTNLQKGDRMKTQSSTTFKLAMVVAMVITMALSAAAQTVYMMRQDNGSCKKSPTCDTNTLMSFSFPPTAGQFTATALGTPQYNSEIRGLAFDNYDNILWGITAQGIFGSVNVSTGVFTPLLTLPYWPQGSIQNEWSGLAADGQNNFYAVNAYGNNELILINVSNPASPTQTLVGHTTYTYNGQQYSQQILGVAYSASGVLYGSDRNIDNVVILSTTDGSISFPYNHTGVVNNFQEIGFDPTGTLYVVYDHQSNSDDAGFAKFDFTTGNATEVGGLPFEIDFDGIDGNSTYGAGGFAFVSSCLAPPSNMVAWYPLDVLSNATNTSQPDLVHNAGGTANPATAYGTPLSITGEVSGALSFNGTTQYLQVPDQAYLNIGANQDLSIDAWVKISSVNQGVVSLVDKREGTPIQGYQFFMYNDKLGLQLANNDNYTNWVSSTVVPTGNQWHLVAVTVDRSSSSCGTACGTFYLDGNAVSTFDPSAYDNLTLNSAGVPLLIGTQETGLGGDEFFNGGLDELEIFNRALNATEVQALYQAGSAGKCK
jgi:Concanavalin A-like lectin/glucanases superfamily